MSSVTPDAGSAAGGAILVVTGTGFIPMDSELDWKRQVSIGGETCVALEATSARIVCVAPALAVVADGTQAYALVANNATLETAYSPQADKTPILVGLSPSKMSPGSTDTLTLSLSALPSGADESSLTVSVGNRDCRILNLAIGMGSGTTSIHTVQCELVRAQPLPLPQSPVVPLVYVSNWGYSAGNESEAGAGAGAGSKLALDVGFRITGMSLDQGSLLGGAVIELTGQGFGNDTSELEVTFHPRSDDGGGDGESSQSQSQGAGAGTGCDVLRASDSVLVCRIRSILPALPPGHDMVSPLLGRWAVTRNGIGAVQACT